VTQVARLADVLRARLSAGHTVTGMKFNKTWGVIGGIVVAAPLTIASFMVSIKLGIGVLVALLVLVRVLRGPSESGGVIGVDQQSQAHGRPKDEGNGGGRQTFSSPYHGRP
jgi:hypothetical protein